MDPTAETLCVFLERELVEENQRLQQHAARSVLVEELCKVKLFWFSFSEPRATLDLRAGHEETYNEELYWVIPISKGEEVRCSRSTTIHFRFEICGTGVHSIQVAGSMEEIRKGVVVCLGSIEADDVRVETVLIPHRKIGPMLQALAGHLPTSSGQQQHDDWLALRSTCKQIRDETQATWDRYHTLRTNQLVHDLAKTVFLDFDDGAGVSGRVEFDLKQGQIYTKDDIQYWLMTPVTADPYDVVYLPVIAVPQARISVGGNVFQSNDYDAFHQLNGVEIRSVYTCSGLVLVNQLSPDGFFLLPENEQPTFLTRIEACLQQEVGGDDGLNGASVILEHLLIEIPPSLNFFKRLLDLLLPPRVTTTEESRNKKAPRIAS